MKRIGKEPPIEVFDEFFWLFQKREEGNLTEGQNSKMHLVGTYEKSMELYVQSTPMFDGYEEFLKHLRD